MRSGGSAASWKVMPLAPEPVTVINTQGTDGIYLSGPSLEVLPGGRIVISVDQFGAGVINLPGKKGKNPHFKNWLQGKIFTSNDQGKTWDFRQSYPFSNARLFRDGNTIYLLGDAGSLQISKSSDGGNTWSPPDDLTARDPDGDSYVQAPTEVLRANGNIYLVAMKITDFKHKGHFGSTHAAVVMRALEGSNLLNAKKWTYLESPMPFRNLIPQESLEYFGIPFFRVPHPDRGEAVAHRRWADRLGWHDAHLVQIKDPNHYWHDPSGKTFHLLASAAAHRSNIAVLAKVREDAEGKMSVSLETTPAGVKTAFIPLPGGNLKFHILYDEVSKLYWLVSNQMRDSMTRADKIPAERLGLPCDEDQRLQLHFSKNLIDWCFAGFVDAGATPKDFRYDCSMAIRGNDLCIASLAGETAPGANHNATRVVFYSIPDFRELVY
jgi:hypothetical protein